MAAMKCRGPDGTAFINIPVKKDWQLTLIFSRLAIIDLSTDSMQPFKSRLGNWLTYNGEIYNYRELRSSLDRQGVPRHSNGDVEVLANLLDTLGVRGLADTEAMFAGAWFEATTATLHLFRDRFGEKPLWFRKDGPATFWGSEPKFIFKLSGRPGTANEQKVVDFLVNGYKCLNKDSTTFYSDLHTVKAGQVISLEPDGSHHRLAYWSPPDLDPIENMTPEEAAMGVRERLIASMNLRLRSDVPVAFLLSGGIDSQSLYQVAKRGLGASTHSFTALNEDPRYAERELVDVSLEQGDDAHAYLPLDFENFFDDMSELVSYHGQPVATISSFIEWKLIQKVKAAGYKVVISGLGADEMFTGYYDHHLAYFASVASDAELYESSLQAWHERIRSLVRNPLLQDPMYYSGDPSRREHIYFRASELASCLRRGEPSKFHEESYTQDLLRNRMMNEMFHETVPVLLNEADLNAMQCSVENRAPFLDSKLYAFAQRIPTKLLIHDGLTKYPLRMAMAQFVPEKILMNARKVGFNAPLANVISKDSAGLEKFCRTENPIWEFVDKQYVMSALERPSHTNSESKFLFSVISSAKFFQHCE
jgi:asparagine synthase (glutamine-hydrolysing)